MDQDQRRHNIKMLWAIVLIGIAYSGLLYFQRTLTGSDNIDGIIGVLLGLYICSHPAANVVDVLFFRQGARNQFSSKRSVAFWLALNIMLLLIGWIVIFVGTTHLIGRAD